MSGAVPGGGGAEVRNAIRSTIGSLGPVSRAVIACLVVSFVLGSLPLLGASFVSVFALVPGYTFGKLYVWNVVTFVLLETSITAVAVSCAAVVVLGRVLEPMWGSVETAVFLLVVSLSSGVLSCATSVIIFSLTRAPPILFDPVNGFAPIIAAYGVAIKQLLPEYDIFSLGQVAITSRYIPLMLCGMQLILVLTDVLSVGYLYSMIYCALSAYVYLRFIQFREGARGDQTEAFAFKTFFPEPLQSVIGAAADALSAAASKIRLPTGALLRPQASPSSQSGANPFSSTLDRRPAEASFAVDIGADGGSSEPNGLDQLDADRRKSLAMRALDERLKATADHGKDRGARDIEV